MFEESILPALEKKYKKSHGTIVCDPEYQSRVYRCNHPDVIDVSSVYSAYHFQIYMYIVAHVGCHVVYLMPSTGCLWTGCRFCTSLAMSA